MKKVFISGCYDILHAGHVEFFKQAKGLGDYLIVSFASDKVLEKYKGRKSVLPEEHKKYLLESISVVDEVVMGTNLDDPIFDFKEEFIRTKPQILASTEDDKYSKEKKEFCKKYGAEYIQLPKTLGFEKISTTQLRDRIKAKTSVPLRVDFAGGWLDVPKYAINGAYIVNCAIFPQVSLTNWQYKKNSGLGGSGAFAILQGRNAINSELDAGVGWQDPAIINETGLCVWRSGPKPILDIKINPEFLKGKMALFWTGNEHKTLDLVDTKRDYSMIVQAGAKARQAILGADIDLLYEAINLSYKIQLGEKMRELPNHGEKAKKYCGSGHGGYAVYIFKSAKEREIFATQNKTSAIKIEPFIE